MIERRAGVLRQMTDAAVKAEARAAGMALRADRAETLVSLARVLAPVCEASARVLGQRPYPPQVLATAACARGMLVEMATGEGKTLAAALAATAIGLTGTPVHILTVNRYLAERDAAFASPLYGFFGLSLGLVTEAVPAEARRAAYRSAVTVAVNKDIAFDYMRDRMAAGGAPGNPRRKLAALRGVAPEHTPLPASPITSEPALLNAAFGPATSISPVFPAVRPISTPAPTSAAVPWFATTRRPLPDCPSNNDPDVARSVASTSNKPFNVMTP